MNFIHSHLPSHVLFSFVVGLLGGGVPWSNNSPLIGSPSGSTISLSLASPYFDLTATSGDRGNHGLSPFQGFSPSLFSPSKFPAQQSSKLLKKREVPSSATFPRNASFGDFDFLGPPGVESNHYQHHHQFQQPTDYLLNGMNFHSSHSSAAFLVPDGGMRPNIPIVGGNRKMSKKMVKTSSKAEDGLKKGPARKRSVLFAPNVDELHMMSSSSSSSSSSLMSKSTSDDCDHLTTMVGYSSQQSSSSDSSSFAHQRDDERDMGSVTKKLKNKKKLSPSSEPRKTNRKALTASFELSEAGVVMDEQHPNHHLLASLSSSIPMVPPVKVPKKIRPSFASPSIDDISGAILAASSTSSSGGSSNNNADGVDQPKCKCKKSKCLKLYCDCFAVLKFCGPKCLCTECNNDPEFEEVLMNHLKSSIF